MWGEEAGLTRWAAWCTPELVKPFYLLAACACLVLAFGPSCAAEGADDTEGFTPIGQAGAGGSSAGQGGSAGKAGGAGLGGGGAGGSGGAGSGGATQGGAGNGGSGGPSTGGGAGESGAGGSGGQDGGAQGGASGNGGSGAVAGSAGAGGTAGAAGAAGTAGTAGTAGAAGGGGCVDADTEPNNSEATAHALGSVTDCDWKGSTITGTINGPADEDWFWFHGNDNVGCQVNPTFKVTPASTLIVCAYFKCDSGSTEVTCDSNSQTALSTSGMKGCCSSAASFAPKLNCTGTLEDSGNVYLRARSSMNSCLSYKIEYHY
jgi:hypothetical protein